MIPSEDLIGRQFGRLTAIQRAEDYVSPSGMRSQKWQCRCQCGNTVKVLRQNLLSGHSESCGCLRRELRLQNGKWKGMSSEHLHYVWRAMVRRCTNSKDKSYQDYGGRGIKVCGEWRDDYLAFRQWAMDNGYAQGLSIDRIDCDGNYEPANCRWTTNEIQSRNRRNICNIEFRGESHPLSVWAKILAIPYKTLRARLYTYGVSVEEAFSTTERLPRRSK